MRSYTIDVIDEDVARRNVVARRIYQAGYHAEIFESLDEFLGMNRPAGIVMLHGSEDGNDTLSAFAEHLLEAPAHFVMLVYAEDCSPAMKTRATADGAVSVLPFPFEQETLRSTLAAVFGTPHRALGEEAEDRQIFDVLSRLTTRERSIMQLMIEGHSAHEAAAMLHLSPFTVRLYCSNLCDKIGTKYTPDAVRFAASGHDHSLAEISSPHRADWRERHDRPSEAVLYS